MFRFDHPQKTPIFDYYAPTSAEFRGLLSIPHSGENIPAEFEKYLCGDLASYKDDVDFKVNELVDIKSLQAAGVAVLVANVHRICVDLNRAEFNCVLFWKNTTQGKKLVIQDPETEEVQLLMETYHRPYFEILKALLKDLEKRKKGKVSMIDLHSMPSSPTAYHLQQNPLQKTHRPDFCLSDRKGKTCEAEFIQFFSEQLKDRGYEATLNDPYIGGFVTEYVDQFRTNNIQIEIKRGIYMDEQKKELKKEEVQKLRPLLTEVLINGFVKFDS
jgi:N-formylglutamate amidohydrolase